MGWGIGSWRGLLERARSLAPIQVVSSVLDFSDSVYSVLLFKVIPSAPRHDPQNMSSPVLVSWLVRANSFKKTRPKMEDRPEVELWWSLRQPLMCLQRGVDDSQFLPLAQVEKTEWGIVLLAERSSLSQHTF